MRSPLPSGVVSSRSRVPEVRSRRVAMLVTMNITTNGKTPSSDGPDPVEDLTRRVDVDPREQPEQDARDDDHQGDGAVVAAQLAQDAGRGGERDPRGHDRIPRARDVATGPAAGRDRWPSAGAASTRARKACSASAAPVRSSSSGSVESLRMRPVAQQDQPVAADRLVHDVARDEQRAARRRRGRGTSPRGRGAAPGRGRRWARRGRAPRGRRRGCRPGSPARAGRRRGASTRSSAWSGEVDRVDGPLGRRRGRPRGRGRSSATLVAHGEVAVDARRLGEVADTVAQGRRPGRLAEDGDGAALDDLDPDDGAHQGGLAATARAEQTDHLALGDPDRQVGEHLAPAANHPQVLDDDRIARHGPTLAPPNGDVEDHGSDAVRALVRVRRRRAPGGAARRRAPRRGRARAAPGPPGGWRPRRRRARSSRPPRGSRGPRRTAGSRGPGTRCSSRGAPEPVGEVQVGEPRPEAPHHLHRVRAGRRGVRQVDRDVVVGLRHRVPVRQVGLDLAGARRGPPRVHVLDGEPDAGVVLAQGDPVGEAPGVLALPAERRVEDDGVGPEPRGRARRSGRPSATGRCPRRAG